MLILEYFSKIVVRFRGWLYRFFLRKNLTKVGNNFKFLGGNYVRFGKGCCVGDNCWFQAIHKYKGVVFNPQIILGDRVLCSDSVHISSVSKIFIGKDTLIGSNVYIGDHSHGSTKFGTVKLDVAPAERELSDIEAIYIGERVWVCDGAVILAGSYLADGSIVGANSVVKGVFKQTSLIAGSPAKVIRNL